MRCPIPCHTQRVGRDGFNGKDANAFETFTLKMQFKRAAQLYTTVVTILESGQRGADGTEKNPPNTTPVR